MTEHPHAQNPGGRAMAHENRVLAGLGDAQDGIPALDWAAREAQARNAELHVVRCYFSLSGIVPWETSDDQVVVGDLRDAAMKRLRDAVAHVKQSRPQVRVTGEVVAGDPADFLVEQSRNADVTVLGSRHIGRLGATVLGSVSVAVAARASGPVVVVEGPPGDPAEHPAVVVGVDGSAASEEALGFAFDYAARHGRALRAVFCWRPDLAAEMKWRPEQPPPERAERWLAEAVAGWREMYPDVVVHRAVIRAHPVEGLVAEALAQELLVVGAHARHPRVAEVLGSVSLGVLHHATCPVAVVHQRAGT
jgi:nucleotide-binding universal stress UspA family protein